VYNAIKGPLTVYFHDSFLEMSVRIAERKDVTKKQISSRISVYLLYCAKTSGIYK